ARLQPVYGFPIRINGLSEGRGARGGARRPATKGAKGDCRGGPTKDARFHRRGRCFIFRTAGLLAGHLLGADMAYRHTIDAPTYVSADLRELLGKATPFRSGDRLAGVAAASAEEMIAARMALADTSLRQFLNEAVIPYEDDEVTRLIIDTHDARAFAPVASLTVGAFRDWLLSDAATGPVLAQLARGLMPEMVAATSKLM